MKGARERGKVERGNGDDTRGESLKDGVEDKIAPVLDTRVRN